MFLGKETHSGVLQKMKILTSGLLKPDKISVHFEPRTSDLIGGVKPRHQLFGVLVAVF